MTMTATDETTERHQDWFIRPGIDPEAVRSKAALAVERYGMLQVIHYADGSTVTVPCRHPIDALAVAPSGARVCGHCGEDVDAAPTPGA